MKMQFNAAGVLAACLVAVGCTQSKTPVFRMADEAPGIN
jgi:hypothetical protein